MTQSSSVPSRPTPRDERALREARDIAWLTGPQARAAVDAFVAATGGEVVGAGVHEVHHRPGAGVTVGYDVRVRLAGEAEPRPDYVLLTTGSIDDADAGCRDRVVRLALNDRTVHAWRHPDDPLLPGLPAASDVTTAAARTGLDGDPGAAVLELVVYRPMRRAVLSLATNRRRVYLKVVRRDQLEGLLVRNRCAEPAGAPPVQDVWDECVLVFPQAQGEPLPELLARDGAAGVDPRELLACLDAISPEAMDLPLRRPWAERSRHYADAACNVLPDCVERVMALQRGVAAQIERIGPGPLVPTHGDFHAANILMTGVAITALLDVDTIGPGQRVDDLACLVGHLSVLPCLAPQTYVHVPTTIVRWLSVFDRVVHPAALRARAAGVVLSLLASMPANHRDDDVRRDALARLAVAEALLADASRL